MASKVLLVAVVAAIIGLSISTDQSAAAAPVLLRPAGSTVPGDLLSQWRNLFAPQTNNMVNMAYFAQPTGTVKNLFMSNAADFALLDVPLTTEEKSQAESVHESTVAHFPVAAAGLAIVYNTAQLGLNAPLKLNAMTLAKIFSGEITMWNDTQLVADNPAMASSAVTIKPVVLSGQFGANFILTRYLKGEGASTNTPSYTVNAGANQITVTSSAAAVDQIANTIGSIAYVPFGQAEANSLAKASIMNAAGFIQPSVAAFNDAQLAVSTMPSGTQPWTDNLLLSQPGTAYPISFYVYALFNTDQGRAGANGAAVGAFMQWVITPSAQEQTTAYGFAPLSALALSKNNYTLSEKVMIYAPGTSPTDYWPYVAPVAVQPSSPPPAAPPSLTRVPSSKIQIFIIVFLVIGIIAVIGYDNYRGGCIIKCNSTGRGVWA